ncbi:hypothetical protein HALA3H3_650024 [Halomonas sp. A3H3]|uniref:Uncharacterized protein n=1 Tax=Vreelandella titanicae TaxID=664683 RepID=A0AAP9NNJ6_9GAMM|nr:hypothetical protein FX987_02722 [Halomonas titanicae]CDG53928.1 hypothetical protein HALA3H3_650024 [Halomonas sp. A3H3]SDJ25785.1 hypothetical protein SAMN04487867_13015 [Halomonas titanicae]
MLRASHALVSPDEPFPQVPLFQNVFKTFYFLDKRLQATHKLPASITLAKKT